MAQKSKTFRIGLIQSSLQHTEWVSKIKEACRENSIEILSIDENKNFWKKIDAIVSLDCISKEALDQCQEHKVVPILPNGCGMQTFNAQEETGNAFTFEKDNFWQCIAAILKASVNFEFSYDWMMIRKNLGKEALE